MFKFYPKCSQILGILVLNLNLFGFTFIFFTLTIWECLFQLPQISEQFSLKACLKISKWWIFGSKFQVFLVLHETFHSGKFNLIQNCCPKHTNKTILILSLKTFNFLRNFTDSSFFTCQPKKTQISQFWSKIEELSLHLLSLHEMLSIFNKKKVVILMI